MTELPAQTQSLCPHCLRRIPAYRITKEDSVWLEKRCPACGDLENVLIWKNTPKTYNEWRRDGGGTAPSAAKTPAEAENQCPFDCGLCLNHRQETCTAIVEVTNRCNLNCPVCFADSGKSSETDPDQGQIARMLQVVLDRSGPHPIQISGGEPTIRDDLLQIVAMARQMGFDHIQINTNGIRLAREKDYAKALKEAGAMTIFLQFDGMSDDVYRRLRGVDFFSLKKSAIENCAEAKIGVILTPTLARDVNTGQIGAIIQFAKKWIPTVKGVHFQPMTYLGRHPDAPRNEDRILIPEILLAIEEQTQELKVENLVPPG
jgi:7,8-dihydro-6-hydroxymethylpterin dimethyltransferase